MDFPVNWREEPCACDDMEDLNHNYMRELLWWEHHKDEPKNKMHYEWEWYLKWELGKYALLCTGHK